MKVSIVGATGYTGIELVRLLNKHPRVELAELTSHSFAGQEIADIYPHLQQKVEKECRPLEVKRVADKSDLVLTALPHGVSMDLVPQLREQGVEVIDLSGDYRYQELGSYEDWYQPHSSPKLLETAVYGLPELNQDKIKASRLIANPGCYPTTSLLALYPLLKEALIKPTGIIIDAKSGVTGAGRKLSRGTHFSEVDEDFKAYKVDNHRHRSEIEEKLTNWTASTAKVTFVPHLLPVKRGILATIYADLKQGWREEELVDYYQRFYKQDEFLRIRTEQEPQLKYVVGSNYCDLSLKVTEENQVILLAALDNLIKGSAGQAVQNLNLIAGWEQDLGLEQTGLYL